MFSSDIFKIFNDTILRDLEILPFFIIGGHNLNNIKPSVKTVLIADSERNNKFSYCR